MCGLVPSCSTTVSSSSNHGVFILSVEKRASVYTPGTTSVDGDVGLVLVTPITPSGALLRNLMKLTRHTPIVPSKPLLGSGRKMVQMTVALVLFPQETHGLTPSCTWLNHVLSMYIMLAPLEKVLRFLGARSKTQSTRFFLLVKKTGVTRRVTFVARIALSRR